MHNKRQRMRIRFLKRTIFFYYLKKKTILKKCAFVQMSNKTIKIINIKKENMEHLYRYVIQTFPNLNAYFLKK